MAFQSNQFVCGEGTQVNLRWDYFFGCIAFGACIVAIVFVFWASYKVLFSVPRKRNAANATFVANKTQKVAKLRQAQRRVSTREAAPSGDGIKFDLNLANVATEASMPRPYVDVDSAVVAASFVASIVDNSESVETQPLLVRPQQRSL